MSELQKIDDYVDASKNLLMAMYQGRSQVEGLVAAFAAHAQKIENALLPLATDRFLITPATSGQTLDNIGDLVGIARSGLDDAIYRVLIYAKIADNAADSTLPTLLRIVQQLFGSAAVFEKSPNTLAHSGQLRGAWLALMVGTPSVPVRLYALVSKLIAETLPAGVELAHLGIFNARSSFSFAGSQPWVGGYGSVHDDTIGSPFASLLMV